MDRRQRGVLACTLSANALVFFDQTAVTVALPAIGREFGVEADDLQWVVTAYLLALAVFMLVAGRLADHLGRRRVFLLGLTVFGIGSTLCALAPTFTWLLVARFVQGVGGAIVQPLTLATTTAAVSDQQRGWAIGVLSTGGTSFLAAGPLLAGGLLVFDWRLVFVVVLPVLLFALLAGRRWIAPSREPTPAPIAWGGVWLLFVGLAGVVIGVGEIEDLGLRSLLLMLIGMLGLALFARHEQRSPHRLVDFDLFRGRMLVASLVALFAMQFAVLGLSVQLALYVQHGLGQTAWVAGAALALAGLGTPLLSTTTGRLADRRGSRPLVVPGLVLGTAGLVAVGLLALVGSGWWLLPGLVMFAVARPLVFTPASTGPFRILGAERRAFGASLITELRQLGGVLGVAVTTLVLTTVNDTTLRENDPGMVAGFSAAVFVAAALCGLAAAFTAWRMPAETATRPATR